MKEEVFAQYEDAVLTFKHLTESFSQNELNIIPGEGSWTAAQVVMHVIKSNKSITQAMSMESQPANRPPDERIGELKAVFLNFEKKLQSPDFIIPEPGIYNRLTLLDDLNKSINDLSKAAHKVNLSDAIQHIAFGDITKLELLHFVVYHTRRHTHQLNKISGRVKNK